MIVMINKPAKKRYYTEYWSCGYSCAKKHKTKQSAQVCIDAHASKRAVQHKQDRVNDSFKMVIHVLNGGTVKSALESFGYSKNNQSRMHEAVNQVAVCTPTGREIARHGADIRALKQHRIELVSEITPLIDPRDGSKAIYYHLNSVSLELLLVINITTNEELFSAVLGDAAFFTRLINYASANGFHRAWADDVYLYVTESLASEEATKLREHVTTGDSL